MIAAVALVGSACAGGRWRAPELVALVTAESAVAADCGTTVAALQDGRIRESNPLLGRRPSTERVALSCAVAGAAVWAVSERTHGTRRWLWLGAITGLGILNATHNLSVMSAAANPAPFTLNARVSF